MNNNRYVILNCPTLMGNRLCYSKTIKQCADCTDCVMKQIYEMCKSQKKSSCIFAVAFLADRILQLLDIEEVE